MGQQKCRAWRLVYSKHSVTAEEEGASPWPPLSKGPEEFSGCEVFPEDPCVLKG